MTTTKKTRSDIKPEEYATFIRQINIHDISLHSANIASTDYVKQRPDLKISYKSKASYENKKGAFIVFHRYDVNVKDVKAKQRVAKLSMTFAVLYDSKLPLTDELFDIFSQYNLPLNTWPYFREFTHSTLARMNLPQIVAPMLKIPPMSRIK